MKKISVFLLGLLTVLVVAGCSTTKPPEPEPMGDSPVAMKTVTVQDPYRKSMSYQLSVPEGWSCGAPDSHQILAGFEDIAESSSFAGDVQSYLRIQNYKDNAYSSSKSAYEKLFDGDTEAFEKWLNEDAAKASDPAYKGAYSDVQCNHVYKGTHGNIYEVEYWNTYEDSNGSSGYRVRNYIRDDTPYYVMVTLGSSRTNDPPQTERPFRAQDVALWVADSFELKVAD